jgi:MinD superfamily P-loop ATPase
LHDLKRILGVVQHFRIPAYLVINKADLNARISEEIERFAKKEGLPALGQIPYDNKVTKMMIAGKSAVEDGESPAGKAMREIFKLFMREGERVAHAVGTPCYKLECPKCGAKLVRE